LRGNQSCAACHAQRVGWTGDLQDVNAGSSVYEGSVLGLFGNRKPPAAAYAMAPVLEMIVEDGEPLFVGGHFWDGRATGERLGDPIAEQAQGPFVNPVEQALPDTACVVHRVCAAEDYPVRLESIFPGSCAIAWPAETDALCLRPEGSLPLTPQRRSASNRTSTSSATSDSPRTKSAPSWSSWRRCPTATIRHRPRARRVLAAGISNR
jgi:hypothetical protein